jgi:hypothetical protein
MPQYSGSPPSKSEEAQVITEMFEYASKATLLFMES